MSDVIYKIRVNRPCRLFIDDEEMMILDENKLTKITLPDGEYLRKVVAIDNSSIYDESKIVLSGASKLDTITLDTTGLKEAKRNALNALPKEKFQVGDLIYEVAENNIGLVVVRCANKNVSDVVIFEEIAYGQYTYKVSSIANLAFYMRSMLKSVTIPNSVTSIGVNAFYNCSTLTDVYYDGTEEEWNKITIATNNTPLQNATIHFLAEETPAA